MKSRSTRSESVAIGWMSGDLVGAVSSVKMGQTERTLQNTVDHTRRFKTNPRNTPKYSHYGLGHWESSIKEVEKQHTCIQFPHVESRPQMRQRQTCSMDDYTMHRSRNKRHVDEQELSREKFAELGWFCSIDKQSKLAEQWNDAHLVGKSKRDDEHLVVIRGLTRSARAGRRQARVERWNLGSVKAVWSRLWELKASTEIDTLVTRQKYITNHAVDEHRRTPLLHKMRLGYKAAMSNTI